MHLNMCVDSICVVAICHVHVCTHVKDVRKHVVDCFVRREEGEC